MANEATVRVSLQVRSAPQDYQSKPTTYKADMASVKGASPGVLTVTTSGRDVSFAELATVGFCWMQNLDAAGSTKYVEWGVHDGSIFHPVGELAPGEVALIRLSRNLGEEEDVPGTGTTGTVNTFFLRATGGSVDVRVDAFER